MNEIMITFTPPHAVCIGVGDGQDDVRLRFVEVGPISQPIRADHSYYHEIKMPC